MTPLDSAAQLMDAIVEEVSRLVHEKRWRGRSLIELRASRAAFERARERDTDAAWRHARTSFVPASHHGTTRGDTALHSLRAQLIELCERRARTLRALNGSRYDGTRREPAEFFRRHHKKRRPAAHRGEE